MRAFFNHVELTPETIRRTREHFVDIGHGCIAAARDGTTRVNNLESYVEWCEAAIQDVTESDRFSVTFLQRAYWLQTGDCPALLP